MNATDPRTPRGKRVVARNALRHGLRSRYVVLPNVECLADWESHRAELLAALQPEGALEEALAERVVLAFWRLRRVARHEREQIALRLEAIKDELGEGRDRFAGALRLCIGPEDEDALPGDSPAFGSHNYLPLRNDGSSHPDHLVATLRACAALVTLAGALPRLVASTVVPGPVAAVAIECAAAIVQCDREAVDLPGLPAGSPLPESEPWTAARLWKCLEALAGLGNVRPHVLVEQVRDRAAARLEALRADARSLAIELHRRRRSALLPPPRTLQIVVRYEAHLSRELYRALHELEALQSRRRGEAAPLARLEVNGPVALPEIESIR